MSPTRMVSVNIHYVIYNKILKKSLDISFTNFILFLFHFIFGDKE